MFTSLTSKRFAMRSTLSAPAPWPALAVLARSVATAAVDMDSLVLSAVSGIFLLSLGIGSLNVG